MTTLTDTHNRRHRSSSVSAFVFLLLLNTLAFISLDFFTPSQTAASGADGVCFTDDPNDPDCTPPDFNNGIDCTSHPTDPFCAAHECTCQNGRTYLQDAGVVCVDTPQNCDPLTISRCSAFPIEIVQQPCVDIHVVNPDDTNQVLLDESSHASVVLEDLEAQAVTEIIKIHGLADSERQNVKMWARDRLRAQMLTHFMGIIQTPAADRTEDEKRLYAWLTDVVWKRRIDAAQAAWDQYRAWDQSRGTCSYHEPNATGYVGLNEIGEPKEYDDCVVNGGACFSQLPSFEYQFFAASFLRVSIL